MGLFRSRARRNRQQVVAKPLEEQPSAVTAQAEVTRRDVTPEARPDPDQPGWGRTIGQAIGKARDERQTGAS
jgi:hypothetical protein